MLYSASGLFTFKYLYVVARGTVYAVGIAGKYIWLKWAESNPPQLFPPHLHSLPTYHTHTYRPYLLTTHTPTLQTYFPHTHLHNLIFHSYSLHTCTTYLLTTHTPTDLSYPLHPPTQFLRTA